MPKSSTNLSKERAAQRAAKSTVNIMGTPNLKKHFFQLTMEIAIGVVFSLFALFQSLTYSNSNNSFLLVWIQRREKYRKYSKKYRSTTILEIGRTKYYWTICNIWLKSQSFKNTSDLLNPVWWKLGKFDDLFWSFVNLIGLLTLQFLQFFW